MERERERGWMLKLGRVGRWINSGRVGGLKSAGFGLKSAVYMREARVTTHI